MKKWALALVVVAAALGAMGVLRRNTAPKVNFVRVQRTTLISTLPTNGKVEPFEWEAVRAERAGIVASVPVHDGQSVQKGEVIATISDPSLESELEAGEARVAEASANLNGLESGGKAAEVAEIESSLKQARLEIQQFRKDAAALERLADKQAATRTEVEAARQKVLQSETTIEGLEHRRESLVAKTDLAAGRARLQDAQAALNLARERAAQGLVRSPLAGVVYGLATRAGAYVNPGDLLANVGQLDRLRVRLYVDEPELGRIAEGQPVVISWEALPGKQWNGAVERLPSSIQPLGTRQVGEVICLIANPQRELLPGTNIDATIRTAVVENALVIPKETLRRDTQGAYVYRLEGDTLERRGVKTGTSSISHVQVTEGLAENDLVASPADKPIKPGERVTPVVQSNRLG
ncbi:MAG: efflux RND transporter periplasmic adaptor subunit [Acidobacteriia bacterium]|nr:efflux RND transporter periplasmic adaptor subunit [Terriglobia bacterium]